MRIPTFIVVVLVVVLIWMAYQKRYVWFVRRAPRGATRTRHNHNYTAQSAFLQRLSAQERVKLAAFLYALTGHDSLSPAVAVVACHRGMEKQSDITIEFLAVFNNHEFSFELRDARAHPGHYSELCSKLSTDVRLLQIYLRHRDYISAVASDVRNQDPYSALRDIMPNETVLQQLWVADLQRP